MKDYGMTWRVEIRPQATPSQLKTVVRLLSLFSSKMRKLPIDSSTMYDILLVGDNTIRLEKELRKHRGYVEVNFLGEGVWGDGY